MSPVSPCPRFLRFLATRHIRLLFAKLISFGAMKPEIPSWGRLGRRARREISREVANEYLRSLKGPRENEHGEFVPHPVAWGVGIIGICYRYRGLHFAPKLSNDTAGHSYLIGGLVALYGCLSCFWLRSDGFQMDGASESESFSYSFV